MASVAFPLRLSHLSDNFAHLANYRLYLSSGLDSATPGMARSFIGAFLAWHFLPTASAIITGLLWSTVDVAARRLEPVLSFDPNGALAADSVSRNYNSCSLFLLPLRAAKRGHWAVVILNNYYLHPVYPTVGPEQPVEG
ncbi:hypothetical protein BDZ91DRAFT_798834 [Kalaharituber pfeilii]|nr:hypothetical protein BDZ91DRAFT_798834 [Kalaharituber pfeilii]